MEKGSAVKCRARGLKSEGKNWTINQKRRTMERGGGVGDGDGHSDTVRGLEAEAVVDGGIPEVVPYFCWGSSRAWPRTWTVACL